MTEFLPDKRAYVDSISKILWEDIEVNGMTDGVKQAFFAAIRGIARDEEARVLAKIHKQQQATENHKTINRSYIEEKIQEAMNIAQDRSHPISHTRMYFEELIREITSAGIQEGMKIQHEIMREAQQERERYERENPRL